MAEAAWFGGRLRELRLAAGLSRKELAARAGMQSEAGIRDLEQGRRRPIWETVLALSAALGVDCTAFTVPPTAAAPAEEEKAKEGDKGGENEAPKRPKKRGKSGA